MTTEVYETIDGYMAAVEKKVESKERFLAYMTGSKGEEESWCFYCDKYKDTIKENVLKDSKLTVLKGIVNTKEEWVGVKDHPWKKHRLLAPTGVPCLVLIEHDQVLHRASTDPEIENDEFL